MILLIVLPAREAPIFNCLKIQRQKMTRIRLSEKQIGVWMPREAVGMLKRETAHVRKRHAEIP
jgi:hypothetical protein